MQESFYPVYNSVQNTPKMNQELDPNFKMFSLFYAYLSDNKRYISESLLVPYMTKSLILDFFFCYNCEMKLFLGKSSATVCGKMGSKFCKQSALKQKPGDCSWQAIPSSAKKL